MIIENLFSGDHPPASAREKLVNGISMPTINYMGRDPVYRMDNYYKDWQRARSHCAELIKRYEKETGMPAPYLLHLVEKEKAHRVTMFSDGAMSDIICNLSNAMSQVQKERKCFTDMRTNKWWGVHSTTYRSIYGVIPELRIRSLSRMMLGRLFGETPAFFQNNEVAHMLQNIVVKAGKVRERKHFVPCSRSYNIDNVFRIDVADFGKAPSSTISRVSNQQHTHWIKAHPHWAIRVPGKMSPIAYDSKCRPVLLLDAAYRREPLRKGEWWTGTWTAWMRGQINERIDCATTGFLYLNEQGILGVGDSECEAAKATHEMLALVGRHS